MTRTRRERSRPMSGLDELVVREVIGDEMTTALELAGRALRDNPGTLAWH